MHSDDFLARRIDVPSYGFPAVLFHGRGTARLLRPL